MLKKFILLTAMLISAWLPAHSDSYPRISGAQIFVIDKMYDGNLDEFFKGLKSEGYDTVILRVFHNSVDRYHYGDDSGKCKSGVYFKTDSACVVRDVLGEAVKAAHRNGMSIYAWMATRTLSFLKTPDKMEKNFDDGNDKDGYGFSIFNKEAREITVRLFADLASYSIDGILFQDDFILRHREGASKDALAAYYNDTGIELTEQGLFGCQSGIKNTKVPGGCPDTFIPWAEWKNAAMTDFFRELKTAAMQVNPKIKFAGNVYYETPLDREIGIAWYSQSIDSMLESGFDYLAVMGYHDQISKELSVSVDTSIGILGNIINSLYQTVPEKSRIMIKVQRASFYKDRKVEPKDIESVCSLLDKYPEISRVTVPVNSHDDIAGLCFGK
ncbi:MAG: poly-beta-1,6-N-acetyl-D-glucosamine N-deacetylase PgaB [Deferribacterales bacterium]